MPNERGWYTKEEVLETGLPYFVPASNKWSHEPYPYAVLLSKSRCEQFGMPIMQNGQEKPSAFKYKSSASGNHRYVPLYDRTSVFVSGEISFKELFRGETMGIVNVEVII